VEMYLIVILFLLGVSGMILKDNLIKKIIALNILNSSIVMFFVYFGSLSGSEVPILLQGVKDIVDPMPQALMLTAIVIGICLTAVALALIQRIFERFGTLSASKIERETHHRDG
jgi:multicomponent Na+:H+ antiporter subunit C